MKTRMKPKRCNKCDTELIIVRVKPSKDALEPEAVAWCPKCHKPVQVSGSVCGVHL